MNRGQKILLLLIGMTAAPFLLAQIAYRYYENAPRRPTINRGELVAQPATIDALRLVALPGPTLEANKWWLLMYRPRACDAQCLDAEKHLYAIPTLMGRESDRIDVGLLVDSPEVATNATKALPRYRAQAALRQYRNGLFIIDPRGNFVLWYRPEQVGQPVLTDLKYLLKNSGMG